MSWINDLVTTYDNCIENEDVQRKHRIAPPFHVTRQAHIELTISGSGKFKRAAAITPAYTVIPATEKSATARTRAVVPHPLCDYVKYCAADAYGPNRDNKYFDAYFELLRSWCNSPYSDGHASAVLKYVSKKRLVTDLVDANVLEAAADGSVKEKYAKDEKKPAVFKGTRNKPLNALIRWTVEDEDIPGGEVWKNRELQEAWGNYCDSISQQRKAICFHQGGVLDIAEKHPGGIRGDNAKLISNKKENESDFVYLGRFCSVDEAAGLSSESSSKTHSCLEWLVKRQGYRNGGLVYVAWSPRGVAIPDPFENSSLFFERCPEQMDLRTTDVAEASDHDVGQHFAIQLNKAIAGYKSVLKPDDQIIIVGVDSATPGRLSLVLYRKIAGSDFLERIEKWHSDFAWHQNYSKKLKFVGAPNPEDIAEAAYGQKLDEKLKQATIQRIIPCIIDSEPFPKDIVFAMVNRMTQRMSMDGWEWNKFLGITCSVYKGFSCHHGKEYQMTLEGDNASRDYLFGRLLAIADHLESRALFLADENRDTNAERQVQRFADFPFSTWKTIELAIAPYKSQLRSKRAGLLHRLEVELDEVMSKFSSSDFKADERLSGEFLLGFHCQRRKLWAKPDQDDESEQNDN